MEGGNGNRAVRPGQGRRPDLEIETEWGLGGVITVAFFCAACWLAVGLLVVATIMLRSGWLTPVLVALALVTGAVIGLLPMVLYRRKAKLAGSALRAVVAELPDQTLMDARAREPGLPARSGSVLPGPAKGRLGPDVFGGWCSEEKHRRH